MLDSVPGFPERDGLLWGLFAGLGGLGGSFAVAGFTPAFIAAPISNVLATEMPAVVIRFAILTLGSLGQKLNLMTAIGLSGILLGTLGLIAYEIRSRTAVAMSGAISAVTMGGLVGLALTRTPGTAIGVGGGMGLVFLAREVSSRFNGIGGRVDPGRRRVLGGLATLAGIGAAGAINQAQRSSSNRSSEPEALSGDGPDGLSTSTPQAEAQTHTQTISDSEGSSQEPSTLTADVSGTPLAETTGAAPTETPTQTPKPDRSPIEELLHEAKEKSLEVPDLEPLVSESCYEVDINAVNPDVDAESWSLSITGAVENERTYSWNDITNREFEHRFVTLRCVGEPLNGEKMDNALWTGVPVDSLLAEAEPASDCECVMLRAADGYFEEFPLEALRGGLLAYGMNGDLLPRGHGHPVRALVPGHWGEVNVKWLTEIELLEREAKGYWEKRGWHGTGPVHTVAKLHAVNRLGDGRIQVAGHAYAGTRGIKRVELSMEGMSGWVETRLSEPLPGNDVWRQWVHEYDAPSEEHEVVVRAVDGNGDLQEQEKSRAFPSGAAGWVTRLIQP